MRPLDIKLFWKSANSDHERNFLREVALPGLAVAGDQVAIAFDDYEDCDVAFILYSPRLGGAEVSRFKRRIRHCHGQNLLILEMPLTRGARGGHSRLGFDHVHRGGRFTYGARPDDRFLRLGLRAEPWRSGGDAVIVAGQIDDDYSLDGLDAFEWACDVASHVRKSEPSVVVRTHPLDTSSRWDEFGAASGIEISRRPLEEDLGRAACWVSYTSGSSIDAVLAGVPSVTLSPDNFCWDVCRHALKDIRNPLFADRQPLLNRLAYSQWSAEEIGSGEAWRHLRPLTNLAF